MRHGGLLRQRLRSLRSHTLSQRRRRVLLISSVQTLSTRTAARRSSCRWSQRRWSTNKVTNASLARRLPCFLSLCCRVHSPRSLFLLDRSFLRRPPPRSRAHCRNHTNLPHLHSTIALGPSLNTLSDENKICIDFLCLCVPQDSSRASPAAEALSVEFPAGPSAFLRRRTSSARRS